MRDTFRLGFGAATLLAAFACGDGAAPASADGTAETASLDIVPDGTTSIVIHLYGGLYALGFTPSDASTCTGSDQTYMIEPASRRFSWKTCEETEMHVLAFVEGERTLDETELTEIVSALRSLPPASEGTASRDGPILDLQVTTGGQTTAYKSCQKPIDPRCPGDAPTYLSDGPTWSLRNQLESLARRQR